MTDKEMILELLHKIANRQKIVKQSWDYILIENCFVGEDIVFNFDENGKLLEIGC